MTIRNIVKIDEEKCNGCGECVPACAEGAIQVIDGKAKLVSEIYCDGLGACLGHCPQDAITIEQRDANDFDEEAVKAHLAAEYETEPKSAGGFVCPSTMSRKLKDKEKSSSPSTSQDMQSELSHWPVQLNLISPQAECFKNADLLITADCVPFAMADFHDKFLKDHSLVIGCPKLDDGQFYIDKLAQIFSVNRLNSLTVVHMEVPCCFGLVQIVKEAIAKSGIDLPFKDVTITLDGKVAAVENI